MVDNVSLIKISMLRLQIKLMKASAIKIKKNTTKMLIFARFYQY